MIEQTKFDTEMAAIAPMAPDMTESHKRAAPRGAAQYGSAALPSTYDGYGAAPTAAQQRQGALLVQRALAPFVNELERVRQELSRERQGRIAAETRAITAEEQAREALQRAVAAEWRVALLRGELMDGQTQRRGWWPWSRR